MNAPRSLCLAAALFYGCIDRPVRDAVQQPTGRAPIDRNALGEVLVRGKLPADLVPVGAVFGNAVELVGYRLEPPAPSAGQYARVTLYWHCKAALTEPWRIFVHLDDAGGSGLRINRDHDPAGGRFPADAWAPGDLIADPIVYAAQQGPLMFFVGFFSSGETRLPLTSPGRGKTDGTNRLLAGILPVAK